MLKYMYTSPKNPLSVTFLSKGVLILKCSNYKPKAKATFLAVTYIAIANHEETCVSRPDEFYWIKSVGRLHRVKLVYSLNSDLSTQYLIAEMLYIC